MDLIKRLSDFTTGIGEPHWRSQESARRSRNPQHEGEGGLRGDYVARVLRSSSWLGQTRVGGPWAFLCESARLSAWPVHRWSLVFSGMRIDATALRRLIELISGRPMTRRERAVLARFLLHAKGCRVSVRADTFASMSTSDDGSNPLSMNAPVPTGRTPGERRSSTVGPRAREGRQKAWRPAWGPAGSAASGSERRTWRKE
jgi:hypothetical protein